MMLTRVPRKNLNNEFAMNKFSNVSRFFHWLIAGLIISQYCLAKLAEIAKSNDQVLDQLALLANHKSIGITVLLLAVLRLAYRLKYPPVKIASSMPLWQHYASNVSHVLLYTFLFAMPLSGWLMSSAKAYSVSWFNLFALPDFIAPSESLADVFHTVHHYLAEALFVVTMVHVAAALKHHFIDKDEVLTGMAGRKSWLLLLITVFISMAIFGRLFSLGSNDVANQQQLEPKDATIQAIVKSDLPTWKIDYQDSFIKFTGDQAGAAFSGVWQKWQADIQFDAEDLSKARFNVSIDPSSGFTNDQERDDTIRSPEFFDVMQFIDARYQASDFSVDSNGFTANGTLTMKGFRSDAILSFNVIEENGKIILTGTAPLDRLVWNIGSGDWTDTSWVGQQVVVEVRVVKQQ